MENSDCRISKAILRLCRRPSYEGVHSIGVCAACSPTGTINLRYRTQTLRGHTFNPPVFSYMPDQGYRIEFASAVPWALRRSLLWYTCVLGACVVLFHTKPFVQRIGIQHIQLPG